MPTGVADEKRGRSGGGRQFLKPNGVSVLISAQNDVATIEQCIRSFVEFGDEVIVVTNDSSDGTPEIAEDVARTHPSVTHVNVNGLRDLYENRAIALKFARFRWVFRGDGDYIAYTGEDGDRSIAHLRRRILRTTPVWPTVYYLRQVNLTHRLDLTAVDEGVRSGGYRVPPCFGGHMPRIYLHTPFLAFRRLGRWEGVPHLRLYRRIYLEEPYWFHCTLKSERDLFLRSERTNWREHGDFHEFPTVEQYIANAVLPEQYPGKTLDAAAHEYVSRRVRPLLRSYDETTEWKYPSLLRELMVRRPDLTTDDNREGSPRRSES